MTLKPLSLITGLGLVCLLSACAEPMPKDDPNFAMIDLQQGGNSSLLAERIDDQNLSDGRYVVINAGAHRLGMTLITGTNGSSAVPICMGHLEYGNFQAGEHYHVSASKDGFSASASLVDSHGKEVAQSDSFTCA